MTKKPKTRHPSPRQILASAHARTAKELRARHRWLLKEEPARAADTTARLKKSTVTHATVLLADEYQRLSAIVRSPAHTRLDKHFRAEGISIHDAVVPLFMEFYWKYVLLKSNRIAWDTAYAEHRTLVQRYQTAVRSITHEEAPFSSTLKGQLRTEHKALNAVKPGSPWFQYMRQRERGLLLQNANQPIHRHPIWKVMETMLYILMKEAYHLSDRKIWRLLAALLETYTEEPSRPTRPNTIRKRVQRVLPSTAQLLHSKVLTDPMIRKIVLSEQSPE